MIETRMADHVPHAAGHAGLGIVRPEHQASDFGEYDRPRALRARLERDVQRAVVEAIGGEGLQGALEGEQLGELRAEFLFHR